MINSETEALKWWLMNLTLYKFVVCSDSSSVQRFEILLCRSLWFLCLLYLCISCVSTAKVWTLCASWHQFFDTIIVLIIFFSPNVSSRDSLIVINSDVNMIIWYMYCIVYKVFVKIKSLFLWPERCCMHTKYASVKRSYATMYTKVIYMIHRTNKIIYNRLCKYKCKKKITNMRHWAV